MASATIAVQPVESVEQEQDEDQYLAALRAEVERRVLHALVERGTESAEGRRAA